MTTSATYPSDGLTSPLAVPFPYLDKTHVRVSVNGGSPLPSTAYVWPTSGSIRLNTAVPAGQSIRIYRSTPAAALTTYHPGTTLTKDDLETDSLQALFRLEEVESVANRALVFDVDSPPFSPVLPDPVPGLPLVWNEGGNGISNGDLTLTGDMLLRSSLADADTTGLGAKLIGWKHNKSGAVKQWVLDELRRTVRPEHFGAVADGVTDDSAALSAAVAAAATINGEVVLTGGKTYRINSALVFTDIPVCIRSEGSNKAVIYHAGQSFDLLTIQGHSPGSQFLTAPVTVNSRAWPVASTTSIQVGDLMEVKSTLSWYHDPRPGSTDARKSELHRVAYISGNTVYTEDGANDGYNTATETVTLGFYRPVRVRLENIVVRAVRAPEGVDAANIGGIELKYCNEPMLVNVDVEDCAAAGITLTECYRPTVQGGHTFGANAFFTGYGVQTAGTAHAVIRGRRFWNCRRGVDISGEQIISRDSLIESNVVFGGGKDATGMDYGYDSTGTATNAFQYGFGSHGPADHTTYRGNITANLTNHYTPRGRNEVIESNKMIGRARTGMISIGFGEHLTVRFNTTYDGWAGLKNGTVYDGGPAVELRRPDWFVKIDGSADPTQSYEGARTGTIVIEDNDVSVQEAFLMFYTTAAGAVFNNVSIRNNRVRFFPKNSTTDCYLANNLFGSTEPMQGWSIGGNDLRMTGGRRLYNLGGISLADNTSIQSHQRSYRLTIGDDGVATVPLPEVGPGNFCRIIIDDGNSVYGCVRVAQLSTTMAPLGTPSLIGCASTSTGLTGTTGTDGQVNVALANGKLYVENRLGASTTLLVTVMHAR